MVSTRVKKRTSISNRRKFSGNRYTKLNEAKSSAVATTEATGEGTVLSQQETVDMEVASTSESLEQQVASQSKVEEIETETIKHTDNITGNRIIDMEILSDVMKTLCCPQCNNNRLRLNEKFSKKQGFASLLSLKCRSCGYVKEFYTSKQHEGKRFDINKRFVYGMRSCGQGYAFLEKFTSLLDMPRPMTKKNFNVLLKKVTEAVIEVANETMSDAATELKSEVPDLAGPVDIGISADGTWQKRGFSSLNGNVAVIAIDSGKVLDVEPLSRHCRLCKSKSHLKQNNIDSFNEWYRTHENNCTLNYKGSAGGMEVVGSANIFQRSIEKHNLRYVKYLGDGDSKSFPAVQNTYEGIEVEKLECIGHVQKRVGSRLRNLKKANKGLGGKGKLTDNMIDKLQNYYGIALRSNVVSVNAMKKAIYASLFHVASSAKENWHSHCPDGISSWCQFKKDKAAGTHLYKPGKGLPMNIVLKIKPIFEELSKESLLEKCLHGRTQNANESFNGMVWQRIPKVTYVGLDLFRFGVFDAVAHFNVGWKASVLIFEKLSVIPGRYCSKGFDSLNKKRLVNAAYKSSVGAKKRRKILRGLSKSKGDKIEQKEGVVYEAGAF